MSAPMLQIGVSEVTVGKAHEMILAILNSQNADQVKITALETARGICNVNGSNITGCTFTSADAEALGKLSATVQAEFAALKSRSLTAKRKVSH